MTYVYKEMSGLQVKKEVYDRLLAPMSDETAAVRLVKGKLFSMKYNKDLLNSNIRLIVLKLYYEIEQQKNNIKIK